MDTFFAKEAKNAEGQVDLRLRNNIVSLVFGIKKAMSMSSIVV